jgi:hypothetical protein
MTDIEGGGSSGGAAPAAARDTVARSGAFARIAGTALIVVGIIGAVAWAWSAVRTQQRLSGLPVPGGFDGFDLGQSSPSLLDRIDAVPNGIVLLVSGALAVGLGVFLRLGADYAVARTGGSLIGYQVGDELPEAVADPAAEFAVE